MKKLFFIALVFCGSVAAQDVRNVGRIFENKDGFTGEVSRSFTAGNYRSARIWINKGSQGNVRVAIFAGDGNIPDCRNHPLFVKDKNNQIHRIKMRDDSDSCFGVAPSVLFEEQFSVRIPLFRNGYDDIHVDARNYDVSVLTK